MNRRRATLLLCCAICVASGWAGWQVGVKVDETTLAAAARRARQFLPSPPPAPSGWHRGVKTAKPSFGDDELAARSFADPGAAVTEVMAEPVGPERNLRIVSLLRGWARRDPLAAAEWLAGLPPSETPELPFSLIEPIFAEAPVEAASKGLLGFLAAKASPTLLARAAEGHALHHGMANQLHTVAEAFATWSVWQPAETIEWVRGLQSPEARRWLMAEAVGAMAKNGAAEEAIAFFNSEPELHETGGVRLLADGWARSDPAAALEWAKQVPDEELKNEYLAAAFRALPASHASSALPLTAEVTDPTERQSLRGTLFRMSLWNQTANRRWIESDTSLSEVERAEWRAKLDPPR